MLFAGRSATSSAMPVKQRDISQAAHNTNLEKPMQHSVLFTNSDEARAFCSHLDVIHAVPGLTDGNNDEGDQEVDHILDIDRATSSVSRQPFVRLPFSSVISQQPSSPREFSPTEFYTSRTSYKEASFSRPPAQRQPSLTREDPVAPHRIMTQPRQLLQEIPSDRLAVPSEVIARRAFQAASAKKIAQEERSWNTLPCRIDELGM